VDILRLVQGNKVALRVGLDFTFIDGAADRPPPREPAKTNADRSNFAASDGFISIPILTAGRVGLIAL
jgi:hypothetical protein